MRLPLLLLLSVHLSTSDEISRLLSLPFENSHDHEETTFPSIFKLESREENETSENPKAGEKIASLLGKMMKENKSKSESIGRRLMGMNRLPVKSFSLESLMGGRSHISESNNRIGSVTSALSIASSIVRNLFGKGPGNAPSILNLLPDAGIPEVSRHQNEHASIITSGIFKGLSLIPMRIHLEGPHICVHESLEETSSKGDVDISCERYKDASICTIKKDGGKILKRVHECCEGYTTDDIFEFGCPNEIIDDLLANTTLPDVANNYTLLYTSRKPESYLLPEIQNVYDWQNGEVLVTTNNQEFVVRSEWEGSRKSVYLNCAIHKQTMKTSDFQMIRFKGTLKPASHNILEIIEANPNLSIFYNLLGDQFKTFLREAGQSTVFAFTNEAFEKLSESAKRQLLGEERKCNKDVMQQHFTTNGSFCEHELPREIMNMNENKFRIQKEPTLKIGNASIIESSLYSRNGIVHIIDEVLIDENFLSWQDTVRGFNPELADALENTTFTSPVTVFIPPSDDNDTIGIGLAENYILSNTRKLTFNGQGKITTDSGSEYFTSSMSDESSELISFSDDVIAFFPKPSSRPTQIGCSRLISKPINQCNAVIHLIDKPLPIVNQTIDEFLEDREDLSSFYDLWQSLNTTSLDPLDRITLFVPINDAFSPNFLKKLRRSQESIDSFVKRHIVRSILCSFDIEKIPKKAATKIESINDEKISQTPENGVPGVNGARIQESEIMLKDGVVYILELPIEKKERSDREVFRNQHDKTLKQMTKEIKEMETVFGLPNPLEIVSKLIP